MLEGEAGLQVVSAIENWQAGDEIIYLLHDSRPNLLKRLTGATASSHLAIEKLPEVEEIPIPAPALETPVEVMIKPKTEVLQPPTSS